jgi:hypothetical protein
MQLLDSSVFLVGTPGGEKKLATKGNNGCHIEGRLLVSPKEIIKEVFSTITPI